MSYALTPYPLYLTHFSIFYQYSIILLEEDMNWLMCLYDAEHYGWRGIPWTKQECHSLVTVLNFNQSEAVIVIASNFIRATLTTRYHITGRTAHSHCV